MFHTASWFHANVGLKWRKLSICTSACCLTAFCFANASSFGATHNFCTFNNFPNFFVFYVSHTMHMKSTRFAVMGCKHGARLLCIIHLQNAAFPLPASGTTSRIGMQLR